MIIILLETYLEKVNIDLARKTLFQMFLDLKKDKDKKSQNQVNI